MKTTLLEIVQSILSDMDSENVNTISDSVEAQQVASVVEDTYYNIIAARYIPEHDELIKLGVLSDSTKPTHFTIHNSIKEIKRIEYNIGTVDDPDYRIVKFVEPEYFLENMDESGLRVESDYYPDNTDLYVRTDTPPSYYTSFNDYYIIMDSYDSSVEATLQQSKTRAMGSVYPSFSQTDSFEPDIDKNLIPLLTAESKSACFSLFKGGSDPKVEQAARRLKSYVQNDMYKIKRANTRNNYGR